ncbi:MAG: 4-hydroxybenzoyl-CoA thioesterase [Thermomicrobiales bacterium]|nr:4-hydroxybenzoyl-CoA thioesterase [Thermomicrobiales bacterium]
MKDDPGFAPETGAQVCEGFIRVRFHEVDALGHVNNAAYLNYLEQAAIDHAMLLGLDLETLRRLGGVFVARRHELVFLRPAYAGDVLRIVTWLGEPSGARVERRYLVFREDSAGLSAAMGACLVAADQVALAGDRIIQATTEWVFATEQGQPRRIPREVTAAFHSDEGQRRSAERDSEGYG